MIFSLNVSVGCLARSMYTKRRDERAATILQKYVRGWLSRMAYLRLYRAAIVLQSCICGFSARQRFLFGKEHRAATFIQVCFFSSWIFWCRWIWFVCGFSNLLLLSWQVSNYMCHFLLGCEYLSERWEIAVEINVLDLIVRLLKYSYRLFSCTSHFNLILDFCAYNSLEGYWILLVGVE